LISTEPHGQNDSNSTDKDCDEMASSPKLRICERCWRPIAPATVCRVIRHPDSSHPAIAPPLSFRHLDADPACTGSQWVDPLAADDADEYDVQERQDPAA
jgi:hypothetical protein